MQHLLWCVRNDEGFLERFKDELKVLTKIDTPDEIVRVVNLAVRYYTAEPHLRRQGDTAPAFSLHADTEAALALKQRDS
jgi:hypothetical protein